MFPKLDNPGSLKHPASRPLVFDAQAGFNLCLSRGEIYPSIRFFGQRRDGSVKNLRRQDSSSRSSLGDEWSEDRDQPGPNTDTPTTHQVR